MKLSITVTPDINITHAHFHHLYMRNLDQPKLSLELGEAGSFAGIVSPALGHQTVQGRWAVERHCQALAIFYSTDHIVVLYTLERLDPEHQNLPHAHT